MIFWQENRIVCGRDSVYAMGMSQPRQRHLVALTVICMVCTGLVALLHAIGFVPFLFAELSLRDNVLWRWGKGSPPRPELVWLAIDQASLTLDEAFPAEVEASPALTKMKAGWPWSRDVYPLILGRLISSGARVVALDLMFPTPREGDDAFHEALEKYRDKVVIGSSFADAERGSGGSATYELPAPTLIPQTTQTDDRVGYVNFWPNIKNFRPWIFNFWPDCDDEVRRANYRTTMSYVSEMQTSSDDTVLFSFASRILQKAGWGNQIPQSLNPRPFRFAKAGAFPMWPIYEIFVNKFWDGPQFRHGEYFRGKIVIVGPEGSWGKDYIQTPFGMEPGPWLHLNAVNAVLNNDYNTEVTGAPVFLLILAGGLAAWLLSVLISQPFLRFLALAGAGLAYVGVALLMFNSNGLEMPLLGFLLALSTSGLVRLVWEQVVDRIERARTRRLMERYVSRDAVREILDNRESFLHSLTGVRKPVTILFSDLRGFTTRTENTENPHKLVAQLNEYFNEMVRIVFARNGTLDKFIGDAVMAHWGSITSVDVQTDARQAVKTALEMRGALASLNESWKQRGIEPLRFGIGINHGEVIVGSFGSEEKKEVSAIGDAVNTASRLEGVTKVFHLDLVIGEPVEPLVRDAFILRTVDCILVQGKTRPMKIFTVLAERNGSVEPAWLAEHESALLLYRAGDFAAAETQWREVLAQCPGDALADLFVKRCVELREHPPLGTWNGVFEMKSK